MVAADLSSNRCAADMIETIPTIMRFLRSKVKDHAGSGASMPQIRVLGFLNQNPGASLSKVSEHLGVSNATTSSIVDRLVQKGLVERKEHPAERRFVELKLTSQGNRQFKELHLHASTELSAVLKDLPDAKVTQVIDAMNILKTLFSEQDSREETQITAKESR